LHRRAVDDFADRHLDALAGERDGDIFDTEYLYQSSMLIVAITIQAGLSPLPERAVRFEPVVSPS
jgi:hypothetical protein